MAFGTSIRRDCSITTVHQSLQPIHLILIIDINLEVKVRPITRLRPRERTARIKANGGTCSGAQYRGTELIIARSESLIEEASEEEGGYNKGKGANLVGAGAGGWP